MADETDRSNWGKLLNEARIAAGLTLNDAAKLLKTANGTVSRWETGIATPPIYARQSILDKVRAAKKEKNE